MDKSQLKRNYTKTVLIIIGIIIAFIMTMSSPLFTAQLNPLKGEVIINPVAALKNENIKSKDDYHSATRIFHIFTTNLPFLNKK